MLALSLVLLRIFSFVLAAPVFGSAQLTTPTKILLSLMISFSLFSSVQVKPEILDGLSNDIISLAGREVLIGLILGFLCRMFFYTISMAGEVAATSLGLNAAQLFNPLMGTQGNILEQFYSVLGMLFFFVVNGHHMFLNGMAQSFDFLPLGEMSLRMAPLGEVAAWGQSLLVITVKLCAPVLVAIFLSQVAMGILGRAIPQVNVLVTSFPVTIMLGLGVIIVCMPLYVQGLSSLMDVIATQMLQVMKGL